MEWNITRGEFRCAECDKTFEEEETYFSVVYDEGADFVRRDYCPACVDKVDRTTAYSTWQTRVPVKETETKKFVDDDVIFNFFLRLANDEDQLRKNFRYVLGLFLMRKRILKFKDVDRSEAGEALVLYAPREQEEYKVLIPQLTEEEILHVTEEIGQILNVQL